MTTKSAAKHTPGPWTYRQTADTFHVGRPVFGVGPVIKNAVWFVAEQIYEEDARLIAASPELLSAAKNLIRFLREDGMDDGLGDEAKAIQKLDAAIAKAEGR